MKRKSLMGWVIPKWREQFYTDEQGFDIQLPIIAKHKSDYSEMSIKEIKVRITIEEID